MDDRTQATERPRVVIVGAGFGGLTAAKALAKASVDVAVVDARNYHLFQPLLYQVATAALTAGRHRLAHSHHSQQTAEHLRGAGNGYWH